MERISVIIPTYNREQFIARAVESVLNQTIQPYEVLIIDDGSTDSTHDVLREFANHIKIIRQENQGPAVARNTGIKYSFGEYIAFLDSDDLWLPEKIQIQLGLFHQCQNVEIVVGLTQTVISDINDKFKLHEEPWLSYNLSSCLFYKKVFKNVGLFDKQLIQSEDWDWFNRAKALTTRIVLHPDIVHYHFRHSGNITNDIENGSQYIFAMIRKHLNRSRRQS